MRGVEQVPWLYDALCSLLELTGLRRWRGWLVAQARGTVLEVGCGTGRNLPLYPAGQAPIALEIDAAMIATARRRAPGVLFVQASAEALPFRDGAFDTVVSSLVFCSVPDVPRGLAEVHRVLAIDGALCMVEHVRHRHGLLGWLQDRLTPTWKWAAGGCVLNRDTEGAVTRAGFTLELGSLRAQGIMRRFRTAKR